MNITERFQTGEFIVSAEVGPPKGIHLEGLIEEAKDYLSGMAAINVTDNQSSVMRLGSMATCKALLDNGMTESEVQALFPEIDFSTALEQIAAIQTFLNNHDSELPGLASMFGEALPEEILTIATDLDMTGAQARWDEFAANPGVDYINGLISEYCPADLFLA